MQRMEILLKPVVEWQDESVADWSCALGAYLAEKGLEVKQGFRLPGYEALELLGKDMKAELILSASERLMVLEGFPVVDAGQEEVARILLYFARKMGAERLFIPAESGVEEKFWQKAGAQTLPEPQALSERIKREKIAVESLGGVSLLVRYQGKALLCLEPIACSVHAPGLISLAQRRLEKHFGGPLGFASRVAGDCPWALEREQWDDVLAYSRLEAFEVLVERLLQI